MGDKLLDQIFNLKFTSKQLNKQSQKSAKEEKAERLKVKKAIEKGNLDGAKIYAQNAIRKKNESLNYLRLASRLDAVVSRLDTQAKMQSVNKSMAGIVKALDKSLASNNLEQARLPCRPIFAIINALFQCVYVDNMPFIVLLRVSQRYKCKETLAILLQGFSTTSCHKI